MAIGDTIQHATARSRMNGAEQQMQEGNYTGAISEAFELVTWAVEQIEAGHPIRRDSGGSKVDALLRQWSLSHLSYKNGFPPLIVVRVAQSGKEDIIVRNQIDSETTLRALTRCAQIVAAIEQQVGNLDAPYGKRTGTA